MTTTQSNFTFFAAHKHRCIHTCLDRKIIKISLLLYCLTSNLTTRKYFRITRLTLKITQLEISQLNYAYASTTQGWQGSGPPIFGLLGAINLLDPHVTPVQCCTIFFNVIDCVVGAVVEHVYSGAVTCRRENTRHQYPEMLYFTSKCTRVSLVAGRLQSYYSP